ncbi:hypothetical protein ACLI4Z_00630 [Natrialbaceae archaeon A-arb3/5]
MKGPGILTMLQLAAGFSMAGPMFVVGFEYVRTGRVLGGVGFFVFGLLALYFPTYIVNNVGGPRAWVRRRLGRVRGKSGDDSDGDTEDGDLDEGAGNDESDATDEPNDTNEPNDTQPNAVDPPSRSPLDRLRRR